MAKNKIFFVFVCLAISLILLSSYVSAWDWFWEDDDNQDDGGCGLCDIFGGSHDDKNECGLFDDCDGSEGYYEWTYENGNWKKIYHKYKDNNGCGYGDGCDFELSKNLRIKTYHFETQVIDDNCSCWYGRCVGCDEEEEASYPILPYEKRQQRLAAETNTNRWFKLNNKLWTL